MLEYKQKVIDNFVYETYYVSIISETPLLLLVYIKSNPNDSVPLLTLGIVGVECYFEKVESSLSRGTVKSSCAVVGGD